MSVLDEHGRPEPAPDADEVGTLLGFLDYQRATLEWKCRGVDHDGMTRTVGPTTMTLGGLLKHMNYVEDHWFSTFLHANDPAPPWDTVDWEADRDWEWRTAVDDTPDELRRGWSEAVDRSRRLVAEALSQGGVSQPAKRSWPSGEAPSLRWILVHMIEEYARHNGHADLLREAVDGEVGE